MTAHVAVLVVTLRLPGSRSLKERRRRIRPIVDRLKARLPVSVAETGPPDRWQSAELTVAVAASAPTVAQAILEDASRIVWSGAEIEVLDEDRTWVELDKD